MDIFNYTGDLLSPSECDDIITYCNDLKLNKAKVTSNDIDGNIIKVVSNHRTNYNLKIQWGKHIILDELYKRISNITSLPIENIEMEINKYHINEYFLPHYDFLPPAWIVDTGGQRLYSCVVYLNDDFKGGETHFPNISNGEVSCIRPSWAEEGQIFSTGHHIVKPVKGKSIMWRNCLPGTTELNTMSLHESLPIISGEKWALIAWIRENAYVDKFTNI